MNLKALDTVERYQMLPRHTPVLAGVSGGADSMALLYLLCSLRDGLSLNIAVAHVNHGLRGAEAERDENFVRQACDKLHVDFFLLRADVKAEAQAAGESVEEAGRRLRYAFFEQKAKELGGNARIATAHTLSDNLETTLLNIARGTGLRGVCGIPAVRGKIIRPLIECSRRVIEEYCKEMGIEYLQDSSNFSREYKRNRVRLDIIPKLYELNPSLDKAALRLKQSLSNDEDYLSKQAAAELEKACKEPGLYSTELLLNLHPALQHRALMLAARRASGLTQEAVHIEKMLEAMGRGSGSVQLRGGLFAQVYGGTLSFGSCLQPCNSPGYSMPFAFGEIQNEYFRMLILRIDDTDIKNFQNINKQSSKNLLDCDRIKGNLIIRSRRDGDRFAPAGRKVTKSLKKLFNEAKIPVRARDCLPLIADEQGIIWVAGFGADERCVPTSQSKRLIQISNIHAEGLSLD